MQTTKTETKASTMGNITAVAIESAKKFATFTTTNKTLFGTLTKENLKFVEIAFAAGYTLAMTHVVSGRWTAKKVTKTKTARKHVKTKKKQR